MRTSAPRRLAISRRDVRVPAGQALVELALILPVMLLLLGGAIDFARLFYAKIAIADAAREGALWAAQHPNSWMQGCDASQPVSATNENQVTCHARNEAAAGFITIRSADVTCSSTTPAATPCATDSPPEGGTVYVGVTGQFTTIMGGITFNLGTTAVGRIVQMPPPAAVATAQTINFSPLPNRAVGSGSFTAAAPASSGLAVTFTTTTPAVCNASGSNGSTISVIAVGTCTVVADQAGDAQWAPAPSVSQSFQVTGSPTPPPGGQTINFPPMTNRQLGTGPATANATASSGLPVTFTTTTPTICSPSGSNGSTISLRAAGTCTVQADQAGDASYSAAPSVFQSFAVTAPPPPSCTAPTLTFTVTPASGAAKKGSNPGTTFTFDATASTVDASCHPVWSWNFGNSAGTSSTPVQTTYIYPDPGSPSSHVFTVTLGVSVDDGLSSAVTRTVTVTR